MGLFYGGHCLTKNFQNTTLKPVHVSAYWWVEHSHYGSCGISMYSRLAKFSHQFVQLPWVALETSGDFEVLNPKLPVALQSVTPTTKLDAITLNGSPTGRSMWPLIVMHVFHQQRCLQNDPSCVKWDVKLQLLTPRRSSSVHVCSYATVYTATPKYKPL